MICRGHYFTTAFLLLLVLFIFFYFLLLVPLTGVCATRQNSLSSLSTDMGSGKPLACSGHWLSFHPSSATIRTTVVTITTTITTVVTTVTICEQHHSSKDDFLKENCYRADNFHYLVTSDANFTLFVNTKIRC